MADRIKGLTIEIDGNTTKLSKALEGVNKDLKDTQTQLKDVEKLLKLDPGNITLLRQKQELLTKAVSDTKEKLDTLKQAQAQLNANGVDKASVEYQSLQREIAATESSLKNLEKQARTSNATLAKIGETSKKVADGAGKVAKATKKLSIAAGGVVSGLVGMGVKAAENADELITLSKQTGLSVEALQKMDYASQLIDVDLNSITSAVGKMKKGLDSNADVFKELGVKTRLANGEYRNTENIFNDTVRALGKIQNETERDLIAMKLFGASADELAGILDDGGAALKSLGEEAKDKGLIISDEEIENAGKLDDEIQKMRKELSASFGKAAVTAAQALTPLLEKLAGVVTKVAEALAKVSPTTIKVVAVIMSVIAALSPVAALIANIATAITALTPVIAAINAVIAANPVVLIIMGIIAAIALLAVAVTAIVKHWDEIKAKATEIWQAVVEKFTAIKDAVVEKFNAVKDKVTGVFNNIKEGASEKFNAVKETISTVLNAAKEVASEKLSAMKQAFDENGGGIKGAMAAAWEGIKGYFTAGFDFINKLTGGKLKEIVEQFFGKFNEIIDKAKTWGKDLIQNFIDGIMSMIGKVRDTVTNVAETIKDFLGFSLPDKGPLHKADTFMPDFIDLMVKGIDDNMYKMQNSMKELANTMIPEPTVNVNYNDSALNRRLDYIGDSLNREQTPIPVNVVLSPNAQGLFNVVRTQNEIFIKSTGQSAFRR